MLEDLDLSTISDERMRTLIVRLLNIIEDHAAALREAQAEIQCLRDENNRLKGEQGKPAIKPPPPPSPPTNYSSEPERHRRVGRGKRGPRPPIVINREQTLTVERTILPPDAVFKGYEEVVVQAISIRTDNVRFWKEVFYAASTGRSYRAPLPPGYQGEFGPGIHALGLVLGFGCLVREAKIHDLLTNIGVQIAVGTISNLLIKDQTVFHSEADAVLPAGLASSPWQQIDDTGPRVNGQNQHCQIICNPLYTSYQTTAAKDRLSVLDVLRAGEDRRFRLNAEALGYLSQVQLSQVSRARLLALPWETDLDEPTLSALLATPLPRLGPQARKWVRDALAVAAYHAQSQSPVVRLLVCDDAPQWTWLSEAIGGCWVHAGRHYKQLTPTIAAQRQALDALLEEFWSFYDELLIYQEQPTDAERVRLAAAFDTLCATKTEDWALTERIAKTRARKAVRLAVLEHPEIPLHNNAAELAARQRGRKRDVSFGPRTAEGAKAWDSCMSLADTTRKLGVSFYHYIHDRIRGAGQIPPLADLIAERAAELNLGASWTPTSVPAFLR